MVPRRTTCESGPQVRTQVYIFGDLFIFSNGADCNILSHKIAQSKSYQK